MYSKEEAQRMKREFWIEFVTVKIKKEHDDARFSFEVWSAYF